MAKRNQSNGGRLDASQLPPTANQLWDLQPGEPLMWYARFELYRALGPHRTIAEAYHAYRRERGLMPTRVDGRWNLMSEEWRWRERAVAWDACDRERMRAGEIERRCVARDRRVKMVDESLEVAFATLQRANLLGLTEEQARAMLPTIRLYFRDMIGAQEHVYDMPVAQELVAAAEPEDAAKPKAYSADELHRIQRELEAWCESERTGVQATPKEERRLGAVRKPGGAGKQTLLVCVGADAGLMVDVAALRAVKAATGLDFHRILDVTRDGFDAYLRRERSKGRPVELLHMAVHAGHEGVRFADGVVEGGWLSERLMGVRVLLLAGCAGDRVGDWLGVVPHVVTLAEEIAHEDAALLTQHFWSGIGRGMEAEEALEDALGLCPPVVGEYVVRHW